MRICVLASGSKGNATYIESKGAKILIDAGLVLNDLETRLLSVGVTPQEIDAIVVTHEHGDHIRSVGRFARKYKKDIYAHDDLWQVITEKQGNILSVNQKGFKDSEFFIQDFTIKPFELPHDSLQCHGFSILADGQKISIATDLGFVSDTTFKALSDSDLVILESNHDPVLLKNNRRYPEVLKQRILSNNGHLSNAASGEVIKKLLHQAVRGVILAHLSEENNSPELAYNSVMKVLLDEQARPGKDIYIDVASQKQAGSMYKLKN